MYTGASIASRNRTSGARCPSAPTKACLLQTQQALISSTMYYAYGTERNNTTGNMVALSMATELRMNPLQHRQNSDYCWCSPSRGMGSLLWGSTSASLPGLVETIMSPSLLEISPETTFLAFGKSTLVGSAKSLGSARRAVRTESLRARLRCLSIAWTSELTNRLTSGPYESLQNTCQTCASRCLRWHLESCDEAPHHICQLGIKTAPWRRRDLKTMETLSFSCCWHVALSSESHNLI